MANSSSNLAFCLEYNNHKTDMLDAFDDYLRTESMVDAMLSCEGRVIKAHKVVLSSGSTYFRDIFAAFKNPLQVPVLIIKDMTFRDLKAIVDFLYRGEVVVPVEQVSSLSKSAQTLFIKGLEKYFNNAAVVNVANSQTPRGAATVVSAPTAHNTAAKRSSVSTSSAVKTNIKAESRDNGSGGKPLAKQNLSPISAKKTKSKSKNTPNNTPNTETKQPVRTSLRNTRRPNYRQLSNGDFNSDDEFMTDDMPLFDPSVASGSASTQVTYKSRMSRKVKQELLYNDDYETEDGMPTLEAQELSQESDAFQNNDDEDMYPRVEYESNDYEDNMEDLEPNGGTSSQDYTVDELVDAMEPRGLIRNPVQVMPRRVNKPFVSRNRKRKGHQRRGRPPMNQSKSTPNLTSMLAVGEGFEELEETTTPLMTIYQSTHRPIKADPDNSNGQLISCTLCPRVFSQTTSLSIHMKRVHGDDQKEHICHLCNKKYSWRSGLYKHLRTHRTVSS